jgi:hypothetical protein
MNGLIPYQTLPEKKLKEEAHVIEERALNSEVAGG